MAVIGGGDPDAEAEAQAEEVGRLLAEKGAVVVCGGLGGVMEAVCRGARSAGGMTVGILPGDTHTDANRWVQVALPTGLGEARNALVVRAADGVIAIGGGFGTLSELGFAFIHHKPAVGLNTWQLSREGVEVPLRHATSADQAVQLLFEERPG